VLGDNVKLRRDDKLKSSEDRKRLQFRIANCRHCAEFLVKTKRREIRNALLRGKASKSRD